MPSTLFSREEALGVTRAARRRPLPQTERGREEGRSDASGAGLSEPRSGSGDRPEGAGAAARLRDWRGPSDLRAPSSLRQDFQPRGACLPVAAAALSDPLAAHGFLQQRHGGGALLRADPPQAGGAGVHLPGAVSGSGSPAEPGLGDGGSPVVPVPLGELLPGRQLAVGDLDMPIELGQR